MELCGDSRLTRQAVTKHLGVLEKAGLLSRERSGRTTSYQLAPGPIVEMKEYLDRVAGRWDQALGRLKAFVERNP